MMRLIMSNLDQQVDGADYTPALPDAATYPGHSTREMEKAWQI